MKQGLLLTLKDLIKLGIINLKKRNKKRRAYLSSQKNPFQKGGVNPIDILGMGQQRYKEFVSASAPPTQQPYTDTLRLRDTNDNFNTRLSEYKSTLENQKAILDNQQQEQNKLSKFVDTRLYYIDNDLNNINQLTYDKGYVMGYADDDAVDTPETFGSDTFQPQTSAHIAPQTEMSAHTAPTQFQSPFKDIEPTDEQYANDTDEPIGKPFSMMGIPSDGEEEEVDTNTLVPKKTKYSPIKGKLRQAPKQSDNEGMSGFNFPKVPVPTHSNFPFSPTKIPYNRGRASKDEIDQWKQWYLQLKLNDAEVLASSKRDAYVQPILRKLKDQYLSLQGTDQPILKSKDPRIVYEAIQKLRK